MVLKMVAHFLGYALNNLLCFEEMTRMKQFLKQCLHDLHFLKIRYFSPNLSKLAPADISYIKKTLFQKSMDFM